jgi:hypothetical protein
MPFVMAVNTSQSDIRGGEFVTRALPEEPAPRVGAQARRRGGLEASGVRPWFGARVSETPKWRRTEKGR